MLSADDPLPRAPRRVAVAGVAGVGKSSLAARIAPMIGGPHVDIDGLFHGPDWTPRPEFLDDVAAFTAGDRWVTEWQYGSARPIVAERADMLLWLDLPFATVTLPRVVARTLRRHATGEILWNGNTEPPLRTFFTDPDHIVRWAFRKRHQYRDAVPPLERTHPQLTVVRLRTPRQVERWLAGPLDEAVGRSSRSFG